MAKIVKIVVDRGLCIGAAPCVMTAPDVFDLDEENKAVMKIKSREKGVQPRRTRRAESGSERRNITRGRAIVSGQSDIFI